MRTFLATLRLFFRTENYLLRKGRHYPALRSPALGRKELPFAIASRLEYRPNQAQHSTVGYSLSQQR